MYYYNAKPVCNCLPLKLINDTTMCVYISEFPIHWQCANSKYMHEVKTDTGTFFIISPASHQHLQPTMPSE